jgi:hypothetical protein
MADGGGATTWEPFEIAVVAILIAGVLMRLDGTPTPNSSTTSSTPKSATISQTQPPVLNTCGLSVSRPYTREKVSGAVPLSGATTGCDWPTVDQVALYAQVIDAQGRPVSDYMSVPAGTSSGTEVPFTFSVPITTTPATSTGTLILISTKHSASSSVTARIPITFVK